MREGRRGEEGQELIDFIRTEDMPYDLVAGRNIKKRDPICMSSHSFPSSPYPSLPLPLSFQKNY